MHGSPIRQVGRPYLSQRHRRDGKNIHFDFRLMWLNSASDPNTRFRPSLMRILIYGSWVTVRSRINTILTIYRPLGWAVTVIDCQAYTQHKVFIRMSPLNNRDWLASMYIPPLYQCCKGACPSHSEIPHISCNWHAREFRCPNWAGTT